MRRLLAGLVVAGLAAGGAGMVRAGEAAPGIDEPLKTGLSAPGDVAIIIGNSDWTSPTLGKMKWIPAGTFTMGSPASETGRDSDETQHQVTLTRGFLLMEAEVTQAQWQAVMGSNPAEIGQQYWDGKEQGPCVAFKGVSMVGSSLPVQCVSYEDIQVYIQKVSARDKVQYRLPTEAEWEYAARAGTATLYAGTSEAGSVCQYGNVLNPSAKTKFGFSHEAFPCEDGYAALAPVKSFRPNAWGLYDMTGNVWEWVQDWYGSYPGSTSDFVNNSSGSDRVNRGGGWLFNPSLARVADRLRGSPGTRDGALGFRLARLQ